jgi:hypothetical protein
MQASAGGDLPVGVDFDGTNDYLSRSSDLVGNADGKTFTFSCWFYVDSAHTNSVFIYNVNNGSSETLNISIPNTDLAIFASDSGGTGAVSVDFPLAPSSIYDTWHHLLCSFDVTNAGNRYIYLDDVEQTGRYLSYSDRSIDFTNPTHTIAAFGRVPSLKLKGRLAGVYLDYTYRDLSVEANRRDFIDADGLYVTPPTSGIISVPMDDPDDVGRNDGTGGDFTLNGTVARSGRGPNQYNAVASTFDGFNDYLSKASALTGATDTNKLTVSLSVKIKKTATQYLFNMDVAGAGHQYIYCYATANFFAFLVRGASANLLTAVSTDTPNVVGKTYNLDVSFDLSDISKRHVMVDGVAVSASWNATYTNSPIYFRASNIDVANVRSGSYLEGSMGEFYLTNEYIDLATENPFYDVETNKPKYLGASGELPTGSSPLIYLPLRADDAGNNLGTGGDFTVNSGPYVGARGASEFIARTMKQPNLDLNAQVNYLSSAALGGSASVTNFSFVFFSYYKDGDTTVAGDPAFLNIDGTSSNSISVRTATTERVIVKLGNSESINTTSVWGVEGFHPVFVDYDGTTLRIVSNGVSQTFSVTRTLDLSGVCYIGTAINFDDWGGFLGHFYLAEANIDFSQESNRLKFVDGLGYPVDLQPAIDAGDIPTPLIHMKFDDPDALGTNSGSGGDFTVTGTVTSGSDVKG